MAHRVGIYCSSQRRESDQVLLARPQEANPKRWCRILTASTIPEDDEDEEAGNTSKWKDDRRGEGKHTRAQGESASLWLYSPNHMCPAPQTMVQDQGTCSSCSPCSLTARSLTDDSISLAMGDGGCTPQ